MKTLDQEFENQKLFATLKRVLKAKHTTYAQLAAQLELSEQSIKRMFREQDCSLSRLHQICAILDIGLQDLLDVVNGLTPPQLHLTKEQEQYLSRYPKQLYLLTMLYSNLTAVDIIQLFGLSEGDLIQRLKKLVDHELIELGLKLEVRLLIEGRLLMDINGPLRESINQVTQKFLHGILYKKVKRGDFFSSCRYLSKHSFMSLQQELADLHKKYQDIGYRDQTLLPKNELVSSKWALLSGQAEWEYLMPLNSKDEF